MSYFLPWSLLKITLYQVAGGYNVVATTDNPVHLWFRYSWNTPWTQNMPRLDRGLMLPGDSRICFNAFRDIEQQEAGNTLTHTFIVNFFNTTILKRQTIYYLLHGTVWGFPSPCTTVIQELTYARAYEHVEPPLPGGMGIMAPDMAAQSFRCFHEHFIIKIRPQLHARFNPCTVYAWIYGPTLSDPSVQAVLCSGKADINGWHAGWWWPYPEIWLSGYWLKPGSMYGIILTAHGQEPFDCHWRGDLGNHYPYGNASWYQEIPGWTNWPDWDLRVREWGHPPWPAGKRKFP